MVGLFVEVDPVEKLHNGQTGLFKGGGFYSLGVQTLACVCIIAWAGAISFLQLFVSNICKMNPVEIKIRKEFSSFPVRSWSIWKEWTQTSSLTFCTTGLGDNLFLQTAHTPI